MAQQRYEGPDGTIYEALPDGGYAIVSGPSQAQPYTIGTPDPAAQYEAPKAAVDLGNARLTGQRTQQQMALDAMTAPAQAAKATADAEAARLGVQKAQRDLAAPNETQQQKTDRVSRLNQLARQINRTQSLYDTSIGTTKGLGGLQDYLPTDDNRRFDVAGAALSQQGLAAFRVPGTGTVSDRDALMFDRANLPSASTRDAAIEEQLLGLRSRVDEERKALGLPAQDWSQQAVAAPAIGNPQQPQRQEAIPGARGPAYFDGGTGPGGPTLNGGGRQQRVADPTKAGVAARLNELLRSGAPDARVKEYATSVGASPESLDAVLAFRRQNPGYRGNYNASDLELKNEDVGLFRGAVNSAAQSPVGAYFLNAADALTASNLDSLADNPALARAGLRGVQEANPYSSLAGTITGSGLAAAGAELGLARAGLGAGAAALTGDALYGAAYGAGASDEGNRYLGAAVGGVGGLGGGIAGRAAARGIGNALTGVRNADVQGLRAAGVPLTAGQATGGVLKGIEDRLSGLPVVGDVVNARRREGFEGFNRAALNEALAPINANTGGVIAEQGVDAAQAATRQGYRNALDGVNVTRDAQFTGDYNAALAQGAQVPRVGPEFDAWAQADLDPLVAQPQFNGATIQDFIQQTRGADFGTDAMGNLVGRSVQGAEDAMRGLVNRQAPDVLPALGRADQAYRGVQVARDAVNRARNGSRSGETGVFTPSQLADAAAANAKKFGNSQGTTNQPFFDLTRAGQRVLPNAVPDSGTAGRAVVAGGLGLAGLGGGAGYAAGDAQTGAGAGLATAALLAAGGSRVGQRALTAALIDRPDVLIRLGEGVRRNSRLGGIFGAPLLAGAGTGLATQ